jgi:hypothetical protein
MAGQLASSFIPRAGSNASAAAELRDWKLIADTTKVPISNSQSHRAISGALQK